MTVTNTKIVERVACKFGRDDVRTVRFNANAKRVRVTCKGLPPITVKEQADGKFIALCKVVKRKTLVKEFTMANSAASAYKQAVRRFWKGAI